MTTIRTLASTMLAAFGAIGGRPAAPAALAHSPPNDATVISLSVVARTAGGAAHADVVVRIDGAAVYKHFTLANPNKIVVDFSGATLGLPDGDAYDGVARGGITRIRYSQFTKTVVRVVLTLDARHPYEVSNESGNVRISVEGTPDDFEPWSVGNSTKTTARSAAGQLASAPSRPERTEAPAVVNPPLPREDKAEDKAVDRQLASLPQDDKNGQHLAFGGAVARQQQSQEPRITWSGNDVPISEVLGLFAAFTGRTILPSRGVVGTVTATITNQPWDVALKAIMNANGYDVTVNSDGIIIVDTFDSIAARQASIPLQNRTIRLNYSRAAAVAPMVSARLSRTCSGPAFSQPTSGLTQPVPGAPTAQPVPSEGIMSMRCPQRGVVTADSISNAITITDVPSALPDLEAYARGLDLRQPQVNIKARIVLVDRTTLEGLGLRYDLGTQQQFFNDLVPRLDSLGKPLATAGQILLGGNAVSAIANASARVPSAALQLVYSTAMGNFDFTTFLEALQTNTLLDVQAEPSATVLNNRTANLTAGTQVPIRVIDASAGGNQTSNFPRATVSFQQTGVILTVTPQITANHQVQMKVHVENSDVQFQANDVGAVFPTQKVDNEMLVADGETAVMGGLTQTTISTSRTGIPILVDLPVIGRFFGVTNRTETKRDLLILITPHIIDDGQPPADSGRP